MTKEKLGLTLKYSKEHQLLPMNAEEGLAIQRIVIPW